MIVVRDQIMSEPVRSPDIESKVKLSHIKLTFTNTFFHKFKKKKRKRQKKKGKIHKTNKQNKNSPRN